MAPYIKRLSRSGQTGHRNWGSPKVLSASAPSTVRRDTQPEIRKLKRMRAKRV